MYIDTNICSVLNEHDSIALALGEQLLIIFNSDFEIHVTRGDLLQQPVGATCRSNLSYCVSRP